MWLQVAPPFATQSYCNTHILSCKEKNHDFKLARNNSLSISTEFSSVPQKMRTLQSTDSFFLSCAYKIIVKINDLLEMFNKGDFVLQTHLCTPEATKYRR